MRIKYQRNISNKKSFESLLLSQYNEEYKILDLKLFLPTPLSPTIINLPLTELLLIFVLFK